MHSRRTLRKVNIKGRPRSTAVKIFNEQKLSNPTSYCIDYCKPHCSSTAPLYPLKKGVLWITPTITRFNENHSAVISPTPIVIDIGSNISSTYDDNYQQFKMPPLPVRSQRTSTKRSSAVKSTTHHTYQLPMVTKTLRGFTTRYECNKDIALQARGIVPTVAVKPSASSKMTTQYCSDYDSNKIPCLPKLTTEDRLAIVRKGKKVLMPSNTPHQALPKIQP